jgi:uncharacterized protein
MGAEMKIPIAPESWPHSNPDFDFFYDGLRSRVLLVQRCTGCGKSRFPPSPVCSACRCFDWTTVDVGRAAIVYSYVVHHRPILPPFETPHTVVLGQFAAAIRIPAAYAGETPAIGAPVQINFAESRSGVIFPYFAAPV